MSFLAELQRRNVIRMAGLYLVGAWLVLQVAATLLPIYDTPDWVMKALVSLLAVGFVPAMIISWVFELTPSGLKRDEDVAPQDSIAPKTARRLDHALVVVLVLALGYFAIDKFVLAPQRDAALVKSTQTATAKQAVGTAATTVIGPGIAVLPFDNLSPDPENAFFAGGVFEEVLTKLSKVPELRVISRTSMEQIAKQHLEVSAIGKRLGVSHVLEGSVRRAGDRVRVTVQLIEATTDNHVWAENYDRTLDDVFAIQSEIALAIADQLKITLSKQLQSSLNARATTNQVAYDLYLRANEERRTWRGAASFEAMIALLEPAVEKDPGFLDAQVLLAEAYGRMYWLGEDPDSRYVAKARALVSEITARWPDRPESVLAQAQLLYNVDRDYAAALQKFELAQVSLPGDLTAIRGISSSLKRLRRDKAFLAAARRWQSLDPESPVTYGEVMMALESNQRYEEAIALGEAGTRRFPEDESTAFALAHFKLKYRGELEPMLAYGRRFSARAEPERNGALIAARFAKGDLDGALAVLADRKSADPLVKALIQAQQADLLQLAGRGAEARPLAAQAYATMREAIAAGRQAPRGQEAAWFARAAAIAALAGDRATAAGWQRRASATPVSALEEQSQRDRALADMYRFLGNPEAAWILISKSRDPNIRLTDHQLRALQPYYDALYGKSPTYRAYMARIKQQP